MNILNLLFRRRIKITPDPRSTTFTPIGSVRRKYLLLGEIYSVKLCPGARNSLKIEGSQFNVTLKEMSRENFESFIESWYRRTARKVFQASLDRLLIQNPDQPFAPPQLKVYQMTRAWGRCYYQKGVITLNLSLVKVPQECIDYIVLHELCHFTHHNHHQEFNDLVAATDPDWKAKDARLKEFSRTQPTLLRQLHI